MDNIKSPRFSINHLSSFRRKQTYKSASSRPFQRRLNEDARNTDDINPAGLTTVFHPPGDREADIIFVHSVGAGSQTTWCKDGDLSLFWPQKWLPLDPAFSHVRIHSFGYVSDRLNRSRLNMQDFANSLLKWVTNSRSIPIDEKVNFYKNSHVGLLLRTQLAEVFCNWTDQFLTTFALG